MQTNLTKISPFALIGGRTSGRYNSLLVAIDPKTAEDQGVSCRDRDSECRSLLAGI